MLYDDRVSMKSIARLALTLGAVWCAAAPDVALAQDATVALPRIRGPRRARAAKLTRGVVAGLAGQGLLVVYGKELNGAAKSARAKPESLDAARAADAQYQLKISITRSRRKYFATALLFDVRTGEELEKIKKSYRSGKSATKIGRAIGSGMAAAIKSRKATPEPEPYAAADPDPEPVVAAPPPSPRPTPKAEIEDEASNKATARVGPSDSAGGGEGKVLRLQLGAGTQALSAYTVAVGGVVTGLAYTLSPLMLIDAGARVSIPDSGLGFDARLSFVPVKYAIDVQPAVTPAEPTGRFFNVGASVFYDLELAEFGDGGRFVFSPLGGFFYDSMTVEGQGENTVVVSWSAIGFEAGGRAAVQVNESLVLDAEGRFGVVPIYSEGPTNTGRDAFGFNFRVGAGGRYWISDAFGLQLAMMYSFQRMGLSGMGTRTPFVDDPPLEGATVFSGDLKIGTSVLLAI